MQWSVSHIGLTQSVKWGSSLGISVALATPLCGSSGGSGFTRAVAVLDIRQRVQSERSERRNFFWAMIGR
mgnify:CR=1 FL=1